MGEASFTVAAQNDFAEIEIHSAAHFGPTATADYLEALRSAVTKLLGQPGIGTPRDDLDHGIRSFRCGSHRLYYQVKEQGILIVRVLHYARNVNRDMLR